MLREFRGFAFKGNLVEIAVGLILALAFSAVVNALVEGIIMAAIAAVFGQPSFDHIVLEIGEGGSDGRILIGTFLTALVNFLIVAWVLFLVVKALNRLRRQEPTSEAPSEEIVLLREIRDQLARR